MIKLPRSIKNCLLGIPLALALTGCGSELYSAFVPGSVTEAQLEQAAEMQYEEIINDAKSQRALIPQNNKEYKRLQTVSQRLIPHTYALNSKAEQWNWQFNLINSKEINAWCMPGGKIAFYTAIIQQLKLSDDEIAMVMGHEMTHALKEHALNQINKDATTKMGVSLGTKAAGVDGNGAVEYLTALGTQLLGLQFSRSDETEADRIGQEIAARAGYNPKAAISLWEKMDKLAGKSNTPPFLSTHPQNSDRIKNLKANLPAVMPLYEEAKKNRKR